MACFLAPAALGIMTTLTKKKFPEKWHINWLNTMLFAEATAMVVEHVVRGEIVPWPPFLTAMSSPAATMAMLREIVTVGIPMALAMVLVWSVIVVVYEKAIVVGKAPLSAEIGVQ